MKISANLVVENLHTQVSKIGKLHFQKEYRADNFKVQPFRNTAKRHTFSLKYGVLHLLHVMSGGLSTKLWIVPEKTTGMDFRCLKARVTQLTLSSMSAPEDSVVVEEVSSLSSKVSFRCRTLIWSLSRYLEEDLRLPLPKDR